MDLGFILNDLASVGIFDLNKRKSWTSLNWLTLETDIANESKYCAILNYKHESEYIARNSLSSTSLKSMDSNFFGEGKTIILLGIVTLFNPFGIQHSSKNFLRLWSNTLEKIVQEIYLIFITCHYSFFWFHLFIKKQNLQQVYCFVYKNFSFLFIPFIYI